MSLHSAYHKLDGIFRDEEAWVLFKAAAILETIGWCGLIFAIVMVEIKAPYGHNYVAVLGGIHGTFFLMYIGIVLFGHRSMNWSVWRFIWAEALSNIPFGALGFELWVAHQRKREHLTNQYVTSFYFHYANTRSTGTRIAANS